MMVPTSSTLQVSTVVNREIVHPQTENSGSTGEPKGVYATHQNVIDLLAIAPGNLGIKPGRRVGKIPWVSFDIGRLLTQQLSG